MNNEIKTPLARDRFFRVDNYKNEKWYNSLLTYRNIGICEIDDENVSALQEALQNLGYPTDVIERNNKKYLVPKRTNPVGRITRIGEKSVEYKNTTIDEFNELQCDIFEKKQQFITQVLADTKK